MADFDDWGVDGDESQDGGSTPGAGANNGAPVINGGLLDARTFPVRQALLTTYPSVEPQAAQITGPLRTDVSAEVLQDILDAQARLSGQAKGPHVAPHPETWSINGRTYYGVGARGFNPGRSNGVTAMQTPADDAAAWAGMSQVAVPYGDEERAGYIAHSPSRVVAVRGQAGEGDGFATYTYQQPANSPPIHGHVDSSSDPDKVSDGFVDSIKAKEGLGDAWSLYGKHPQPLATVSHGRVGWHVLDNGQLKFLYPPGAMTSSQMRDMRSNLDGEQKKFLRPR